MKRISYFFFLTFIISLFSTSCSKTKTFAQQLDDEQALITAYVKRNSINVLTTLPVKGSIWGPKDYYKSGSGLYFHLVDSGNTSLPLADTLVLKNTVVPRFKQYSLTLNSTDTLSNWSTIDFPRPSDFTHGDLSQSCQAFQEAVRYMIRNDSQAKLIVPSSIGFKADQNSVTPYGYTLKIKILK